MFSSYCSNSTGFPSKWSEQKDFISSDCQTEELVMDDKGSQSLQLHAVEVQKCDDVVESFGDVTYDEGKLSKFLTRVTPSLIKELDKVQRSKAFSPNFNYDQDMPAKPVKTLYTLKSKHHLPLEDAKVSCLSWSCSGNVLAIGFQAPYHSYFCTHNSAVHLYNINLREFDHTTPNRIIETESCVTRISMHPFEPSIIAVATHDGGVEVWNVSGDENAVSQKVVRHTDSVTQLIWVQTDSQLILASSGLDGVIHLFKFSSILHSLSRLDSYLLTEERNSVQPGVTCFAFSPKKSTIFVAALEGGALLHCSTASAVVKGGNPEYEGIKNIKDPIVGSMARHTAPISAIEFSPYIPDLFAIATIEEKFYIYSLNQDASGGFALRRFSGCRPECCRAKNYRASVSVVWCEFEVIGLVWSGSNAHALYAWGNAEHPALFDCQTAKEVASLKPADQSPSTDPNTKMFIPAAAVNNKNPKLLAVGLSIGETHIYELPPIHF